LLAADGMIMTVIIPVLAFSIRLVLDKDHSMARATCSWVRLLPRHAGRSPVSRRRRNSSGLERGGRLCQDHAALMEPWDGPC